ncbi:MAG: hypothetical protein QOG77_2519 [Solirubrobacteraceae bacterium]|nr:hypothetical protein [Solirubrobacteraceae bacterium]
MTVLVDTATVRPQESLRAWNDAMSRAVCPIRMERTAHGPFRGRAAGYRVGSLGVLQIQTDPTTVARTRADISAFDPALVQVTLVRHGHCVVEQGDRCARLAPGDITVYDTSRPFQIHSQEAYTAVVYTVPRALLGGHADRIRARSAIRVSADADLGALGGRYLAELADLLQRGAATAGDVDLADGALALIRALCSLRQAPAARPTPEQQLAAMRAFVEERLGDPLLGPASIARAHHVSTRSVHRLFADHGEAVSGWIRARRLDRCRRDLADVSLAHETVADIAARWGFTNHAHFSRTFRATFGETPTQARQAARGLIGR